MNIGLTIKRALNHFGYDLKYHRPFYETVVAPLKPLSILDIGANDGHYTKKMRTLFPEATVYAFEPLAACFERIATASKADAKIIPFHTALGEQKETTVIQKSSFHPSSSLLRMTALHESLYPKSVGSTEETITIERLDDIAQMESLLLPLVIKVDVQGFEDRVIRGGIKTFEKAAVVIIETSYVELYKEQPLFKDIHDLLVSCGFAYYGAVERHYNASGLPLYEDAAFIRKGTLKLTK